MKEQTKRILILGGMTALCGVLLFGISRVLYREPDGEPVKEELAGEEDYLTVQTGDEAVQDQAEEMSTEPDAAETRSTELSIRMEGESGIESTDQQIQPTPQKTEDKKPTEPPTVKTDTEEPSHEEKTKESPDEEPQEKTDSTPAHGSTKDGMIYIDGFGWITNQGGGGSGTTAGDMYENGNKVGIMD